MPQVLNKDIEALESVIRGLRADLAGQVTITENLRAELRSLREVPEAEAVKAQANRIRDLVSELHAISMQADDHRLRLVSFTEKQCFFALALGYYGQGETLDEALINLQKAGCASDAPIVIEIFIGEDQPRIVNGSLNVEYNHNALRIRIGLFKSLGAALRNLREP